MTSPQGSHPAPPVGAQPPLKQKIHFKYLHRVCVIIALIGMTLLGNSFLPLIERRTAARSAPFGGQLNHSELDESATVGLLKGLRSTDPLLDLEHSTFSVPAAPVPMQGCQGKCLDPHPGQFQYWNGQQNGCWVQVWRRWPEGCQHYQWYNACNGYWDSYPNGAPKVFWTCCVH